jgi:hypothetical protein
MKHSLLNEFGTWRTLMGCGKPLSGKNMLKGDLSFPLKKGRVILTFGRVSLRFVTSFTITVKKVGNRKSTSFWNNIWCDSAPLSSRYPNLFNIADDKNITVEKVLSSDFQLLTFRRRLLGDLIIDHNNLIAQCNKIETFNGEDKVAWLLGNHGFSVKNFYRENKCSQITVPSNFLWKTRLPHKIKVFCGLFCTIRS